MNNQNIFLIFLFVLLIEVLTSCVKQPNSPETNVQNAASGAMILCEGLWHTDNSTISRFDFKTNTLTNDFFGAANPGLKLGDLANSIVIRGDTAYIAVTTPRSIEIINIKTGKWLGRIIFEGDKHAPRKIAIMEDTVGFVTDLYDNTILEFNPKTFQKGYTIATGAYPEGIAYNGNLIFVANSGYGSIGADQPKASTVSVIDYTTRQEIKLLKNLPDCVELVINRSKAKLYVVYYNYQLAGDSLGGIVEYDIKSLEETNRWECHPTNLTLSQTGDTLFFLSGNGVSMIEPTKANSQPKLFIPNISSDWWYSLAVSPKDNTIWVGNARNFQVNGQILIFDLNNLKSPKTSFDVGVNPNTIVFY
jgi:DNA-binding beta-propeller fold protein YncE